MEEDLVISHRVLRSVSLAVLLLDDLIGKPITGSNARAWIEQEKPPIKKNDGWFVFTDLAPRTYTVLAEGGHYQTERLEVTVGNGQMESCSLRLRPARTYPVVPGCLRVEGRAEPGAVVTVFAADKQNAFKLLADAPEGSTELAVFHGETVNMEGGLFRLMGADGTEENLCFGKALPDREKTYGLLSPLLHSYPRVGTLLLPASKTTADSRGRFFMILKDCRKTAPVILQAEGSRTVRQELLRGDSDCLCPVLCE